MTLSPTERANLPRWRGQPGFVEIWFFVIFAPDLGRAFWLRFSTFAPRRGEALAIQWLAEFDRERKTPIVAKSIAPAREAYRASSERFELGFEHSRVAHGRLSGAADNGRHRFRWELRFEPAHRLRLPLFSRLERVPLATHVAHSNSGVFFEGSIEVDGRETRLSGAPGLGKHIWGTRLASKLHWLYVPRFDDEPALELDWVHVEPGTHLPALTFAELVRDGKSVIRPTPASVLGGGVHPLRAFTLAMKSGPLLARAWCEPESLVGYKYRNPDGSELFVAQSDVANAVVLHAGRRLRSRGTAALEFHGPTPLDGVTYLGFDST